MLSHAKKRAHQDRSPLNSLTDDDLVRLAQDDDQEAMEELVQRYQKQAFSIAYHMGSGDLEEAKDHTQEAFLRAFKNIKRFKLKSSFYTWLYRIIINTCLDGRRRRQRREKYLPFLLPKPSGGRFSREVIHEQALSTSAGIQLSFQIGTTNIIRKYGMITDRAAITNENFA